MHLRFFCGTSFRTENVDSVDRSVAVLWSCQAGTPMSCSGRPAVLLRLLSIAICSLCKSKVDFFLLSRLRNAQLQMQEAPPNISSQWELAPQEGPAWLVAADDHTFTGFQLPGVLCVCFQSHWRFSVRQLSALDSPGCASSSWHST